MLYFIFGASLLFLGFLVWYLATTAERTRRWVALGTIACLLAVCGASLFRYDGNQQWGINIKPGLDIQGGTQFTVQLAGKPTRAVRDEAIAIIRKRIDGMGLAEPVIQPSGNNRIIVQIPGVSEKDKAIYRNQLQKVARLEFKLVHPENDELLPQVKEGAVKLPVQYEVLPILDRDLAGKQTRADIIVKRRPEMSGRYVKTAFRSVDQVGRPVVIIDFNAAGRKLFGRLTEKNVGQRMAIVLDDEVYSAPVIRTAIYGNCEISGGTMTPVEAEELASVLENPLEVPVQIIDERGVDPSLGHASIQSGFSAGMIGLLAVVVFMVFYYRLAGALSVIALGLNMFILLGLLAQFGFTLTMPGVAAMVLTIGMAVDASVLIFERIREEREDGKPLIPAVQAGFNKAFSSIFDANVTTIIAAVMLFWQGSGPIQGFAVVLCLGVLSSMFSALIITRAGFDWLFVRGTVKSLSMARFLGKTKIDFLGKRGIGIVVSLILFSTSFVVWLQRGGDVYGVDFAGGDLMTLRFEQKIPDNEIRELAKGSSTVVQYQRSPAGDNEILSIRTPFGEAEELEKQLQNQFPEAGFERLSLDKVEGMVGAELKRKAVVALTFGLLAIFLYTMWRFEISFAVGAIVALLHDVVITMGIFILFGKEFSLPVVGAILTVAGYSINDTIIIFDRIREGLKSIGKKSVPQVVNEAINLTLSRTLITSGTTLLVVLALYLFGGMVINDFALILLVGILIGTYSSIFIATPVVLAMSQQGEKLKIKNVSV